MQKLGDQGRPARDRMPRLSTPRENAGSRANSDVISFNELRWNVHPTLRSHLPTNPSFTLSFSRGKDREGVMDASTKLLAAIAAAAAIMVGSYIAYNEYAQSRTADQALQGVVSSQQQPQKTAEAAQNAVSQPPPSDQRIAADVAELRTQYRHLAPNERCVDGVVIQVNGAAQPGPIGKQVRCTGSYAER